MVGLNIKNREVERLADEVARIAGETKTESIRRALEERRARLRLRLPASGQQRGRPLWRWQIHVPRGTFHSIQAAGHRRRV